MMFIHKKTEKNVGQKKFVSSTSEMLGAYYKQLSLDMAYQVFIINYEYEMHECVLRKPP